MDNCKFLLIEALEMQTLKECVQVRYIVIIVIMPLYRSWQALYPAAPK